MPNLTPTEILTTLDDLLEAERAALLSGDFDEVAALLERKTELIDALNSLGQAERPTLEQLHHKVKRNHILLDGAMEGIRRVANRLADLRALRHSFDTYDSDGRRQTIEGQGQRHVEKRA